MFRSLSRATVDAPGESNNPPNQVHGRLHALFTSRSISPGADETGPSGGDVEPQLNNGKAISNEEEGERSFQQRDAIKVLVVTWNMGDALPKGDLSVILGDIPPYTPKPRQPSTIPQLSTENAHPYHIVVVAGQECPTHSGIPRGVGGGLIKGVRNPAHRKDKEKKDEGGLVPGPQSLDLGYGLRSPVFGEGNEDDSSRPTSPMPNTPHTPAAHKPQSGAKGWSTMLDDWFCGPSATRSESPNPSPSPRLSPYSKDKTSPSSYQPPSLLRSTSAPAVPTSPQVIPQLLAAPSMRPANMARSTSSSSSSSEDFQNSPTPSFNMPMKSNSAPSRPRAPEIMIPNDEPERTAGGSGAYVHVVKERLMGMYLTVYVYKSCEHLIQGVDKDFVTAGLAGGRVGNKGGIGISLKLADHRFLFINSHLAAHTTRVGSRLANIAKIKSDLRLDCFLPKDDPRLALEDITDRFDTTFWMGDLNFRLDLTRLHAEWLIEHKKYDEALMFDQLKNTMKQESDNPFVGFEEGIIDFPPTFKYDVWKSAKATNRDIRRSLKRRPSDVRAPRSAPSDIETGLSHVMEDGEEERLTEMADAVESDMPRQSLDSTLYTSAAGTDVDDDDSDDVHRGVDATAYGSRHKALEVALKSKTKHLLSLVKMDGLLTPSPSRRGLGRKVSLKRHKDSEFDNSSRRTSMSSMRSVHYDPTVDLPAEPVEIPPRAPALSSSIETSSPPRHGLARRFTLRRTMSGKSVRDEPRSLGEANEVDSVDWDDSIDVREGVYDTSKKQRVPSWCDRVLWRAHVIPDPGPEPPSRPEHLAPHHHRPFNRLSQAFSTLGGQLKLQMSRTGSTDPSMADRRIGDPGPVVPAKPPELEILTDQMVASPESSPFLGPVVATTSNGQIPSPRRPQQRRLPSSQLSIHTQLNYSAPRHPLIDLDTVQSSPPAKPKITFDPALPTLIDRQGRSRSRSNSDIASSAPQPVLQHLGQGIRASPSFPPRNQTIDASPPRNDRKTSGGSLRLRSRNRTVDTAELVESVSDREHKNPVIQHEEKEKERNALLKFLKDLPHWLHGKRDAVHVVQVEETKEEDKGERRRLKGEVVCLHYGTIDDAGMRQLEGRSDHRPAIFAAAVYV